MRAFIALLILVALTAVGIALYRNWLVVQASHETSKDKHESNAALDSGKAEISNVRLRGATVAEGVLLKVSTENDDVLLQTAGEEKLTLQVGSETKILRANGEVSLKGVREGEMAKVSYEVDGNVKTARRIFLGPRTDERGDGGN